MCETQAPTNSYTYVLGVYVSRLYISYWGTPHIYADTYTYLYLSMSIFMSVSTYLYL